MKYARYTIELPDAQLLIMIKENHKAAFKCLYRKYWQPLLNFSSQYLPDKSDCEDVVQDLFTHLYIKEYVATINTSLSAYLHTALKHKILNYIRKRENYNRHVNQHARQTGYLKTRYEIDTNNVDLQENISLFVNRLPEKYRDVYLLRYENQMTIKEVSGVLNRPVDTVEKQSRKLTCLLRENLSLYAN